MEQLKIKGHNNQFKLNVNRHLNLNQRVNKLKPNLKYGYSSCGQQAGLKRNVNINCESFLTPSYAVKGLEKHTNDQILSQEVVVEEDQDSIMHSPHSDQTDSSTTPNIQHNKQSTVMPTPVVPLNSNEDHTPREQNVTSPPASSPSSTATTSPNMDRSPLIYSQPDEDKSEKENILAMEYNAAMKRYTKKIEDEEKSKGKDIQIIKDTKVLTKDIFWFLKHRMIHSVFDKIIKMEYGEMKDEAKHISIEDENSNGVNVELDGRSVDDEVTTDSVEFEKKTTGIPGSQRSDRQSVEDFISCDGDNIGLKSDSKVVRTESNKPKRPVIRNLESAKRVDAMESTDKNKSSTNPDKDAESTRRSISDFLLKKLLFPYDSTMFERSKKTSTTGTKREKDKDRKGKLVEIHVNRDEQYGKSQTATESKQYKDSQRYSENTRYQTSSTKVNPTYSGQGINICVRKRTHEGPDASSTVDEELTCNYCSETNKKLKCHHDTSGEYDAIKQQSTSVKPIDINSSVSQCDLKPQDLTKGNQHQNDLSKPRLQENAPVCQNSKCRQAGILTKSDIVNLIIQRIYFEENEESQNSTKYRGGNDGENSRDEERKDSLLSSDVPINDGQQTNQGNERTMQLSTNTCDININVDISDDSSEFDNLLTKYKKYPIANKAKLNANRSSVSAGDTHCKHHEKTESVSSDNTFCGDTTESMRQRTSSPSGSGSGENQCSGSDVDVGDTYECTQSVNVDSTGDDDVIDLSNKSYSLSVSDNRGSPEAPRSYHFSNEPIGRNGYRSDGSVLDSYGDCDTRYIERRFRNSLDTSSACDNSNYIPLHVVNRLSSDHHHTQYEQLSGRNISGSRSSPNEMVDYTFRDKYCAQTTQSS